MSIADCYGLFIEMGLYVTLCVTRVSDKEINFDCKEAFCKACPPYNNPDNNQ